MLIVTIAFLAAILFPVFSKAGENAKGGCCLSEVTGCRGRRAGRCCIHYRKRHQDLRPLAPATQRRSRMDTVPQTTRDDLAMQCDSPLFLQRGLPTLLAAGIESGCQLHAHSVVSSAGWRRRGLLLLRNLRHKGLRRQNHCADAAGVLDR